MEREFNVAGRMDEEAKKGATEYLNGKLESGMEMMTGEIEKTDDERKMIELTDKWLEQLFVKDGIEDYQHLNEKQFHFLDSISYVDKTGDRQGYAGAQHPQERAVFRRDGQSRLSVLRMILHEAIHLASFKAYIVDAEEMSLNVMRTGMSLKNRHNENGKNKFHLTGINEAIVEYVLTEVLSAHRDEFINELKVKEKELDESFEVYQEHKKVFKYVVETIAEKQRLLPSEVWKKFKLGLFRGDKMFLRSVEETFGKGSLRVLAGLRDDASSDETAKVLKFLRTRNGIS